MANRFGCKSTADPKVPGFVGLLAFDSVGKKRSQSSYTYLYLRKDLGKDCIQEGILKHMKN